MRLEAWKNWSDRASAAEHAKAYWVNTGTIRLVIYELFIETHYRRMTSPTKNMTIFTKEEREQKLPFFIC